MADEDLTGSTARDRRRSRAQANKPNAAGSALKRYKVHLIILLLTAGLATAMAVNASQTQDCPGHWHSTMDIYVDGDRVGFNHPKYDLNGAAANGGSMSLAMHMHQPDDSMWHWEPVAGADCADLKEAFPSVDMQLSATRLVLDGAHQQLGDAGTYTTDDAHALSAWTRSEDGDWKEASVSSVINRQSQPGERIIIAYGNATTNDVEAFQAKADNNQMQASSGGQGGASYVPVVGVSLMGLVVLGIWHAISRKA